MIDWNSEQLSSSTLLEHTTHYQRTMYTLAKGLRGDFSELYEVRYRALQEVTSDFALK